MKNISKTLQNKFISLLKKSSRFTKREIDALWSITRCLIGSSVFSLKKVVKRMKKRFSRQFLSLVLQKFCFVKQTVFQGLIEEISKIITQKDKISLILDDSLVKKSGKHIFGSLLWFDHSQGFRIQSLCLVNVGLAVNNHLSIVVPCLINKERLDASRKGERNLKQDLKTLIGIETISDCISWLNKEGIKNEQVMVLADSWFCTKNFKSFLDKLKVKYRLDSKKNFSVQQPHFEALGERHIIKRGRRRQKWVQYTSLEGYFSSVVRVFSFKDKKTGISIKAKRANITLKTHGRVLVFAFYTPGRENVKYIITRSQTKSVPVPKTIYHDYLIRWQIENAHRELKQQFGIGKSQNRNAWAVNGFLSLVCFSYSVYRLECLKSDNSSFRKFKCPTIADLFHKEQIVLDHLELPQ